jgi:hypothetical protein
MKDRSIVTIAVALVSLVTLAASMSGRWLEQEGRIVRGDISFGRGHAIVKDGAPRTDGRFTNRAEPGERVPLGVSLRFLARRIGASWRRAGAAPRVPYDRAAIACNPSLTWIGHATFLVKWTASPF